MNEFYASRSAAWMETQNQVPIHMADNPLWAIQLCNTKADKMKLTGHVASLERNSASAPLLKLTSRTTERKWTCGSQGRPDVRLFLLTRKQGKVT
jgi:hypothetical protein